MRRTIDSALAQTVALGEILVVDDGSTDSTSDWIETHYRDERTVRLIRQRNGGVASARNRGLKEARGEWIAFLDHDDAWHPRKLESLLEKARPEVGVVYSRWCETDAEGKLLDVLKPSKAQPREGNVFDWLFGWSCPIISMSVPIIRRDLFAKVGGFDPRCVPADDWDLWLRLARVTRFAFVDEELTLYAVHENQQSRAQSAVFRAARRILSQYPVELARRPFLLWWLLWSKPFELSIPAYERAKAGSHSAFLQAARLHPLALFAPQWVALLARRIFRR